VSNFKELVDADAVHDLGVGVSTDSLINFMDLFYDRVVARVEGPGAEQYLDDNVQKFETMSVDDITDELIDELADTWAYIAFAAIHIISAVRGAKP